MLTADELIRNVHDYVSGLVPLEHFDLWFEGIADAYDDPTFRQVYESIEGALSGYYFDGVGQVALKSALADAILLFEATLELVSCVGPCDNPKLDAVALLVHGKIPEVLIGKEDKAGLLGWLRGKWQSSSGPLVTVSAQLR